VTWLLIGGGGGGGGFGFIFPLPFPHQPPLDADSVSRGEPKFRPFNRKDVRKLGLDGENLVEFHPTFSFNKEPVFTVDPAKLRISCSELIFSGWVILTNFIFLKRIS
jgi:hypothetical protein